jgi:Ca-activated chloride channel family protein
MKSKPNFASRIAAALLAGVALLSAPQADAAGLLIADGGFGGVLEIKEHDVKVSINNGIAVTTVTQVFQNTEDRQVEALYTFPVPKSASVANFSMWINGKEMVGEVLEKKRAREIYNSYKEVRRDPGLLEQVDFKTFEMRIFPIAPKAEQRVQISYYQELDYDRDWATYIYPLATNTRGQIDERTTGRFSVSFDVKSAIPIAELSSPSHAEALVAATHGEHYRQGQERMAFSRCCWLRATIWARRMQGRITSSSSMSPARCATTASCSFPKIASAHSSMSWGRMTASK